MRSMPELQGPAFAADWEEWAASPLLYAISTWELSRSSILRRPQIPKQLCSRLGSATTAPSLTIANHRVSGNALTLLYLDSTPSPWPCPTLDCVLPRSQQRPARL